MKWQRIGMSRQLGQYSPVFASKTCGTGAAPVQIPRLLGGEEYVSNAVLQDNFSLHTCIVKLRTQLAD